MSSKKGLSIVHLVDRIYKGTFGSDVAKEINYSSGFEKELVSLGYNVYINRFGVLRDSVVLQYHISPETTSLPTVQLTIEVTSACDVIGVVFCFVGEHKECTGISNGDDFYGECKDCLNPRSPKSHKATDSFRESLTLNTSPDGLAEIFNNVYTECTS